MDINKPINPSISYVGYAYTGKFFNKYLDVHYIPVIVVYQNGVLTLHGKTQPMVQAPISEYKMKMHPLSGFSLKVRNKRMYLITKRWYKVQVDQPSEYQQQIVLSANKPGLPGDFNLVDLTEWHKLFLETNLPNVQPQKLINASRAERIFYWGFVAILFVICFAFLAFTYLQA